MSRPIQDSHAPAVQLALLAQGADRGADRLHTLGGGEQAPVVVRVHDVELDPFAGAEAAGLELGTDVVVGQLRAKLGSSGEVHDGTAHGTERQPSVEQATSGVPQPMSAEGCEAACCLRFGLSVPNLTRPVT